jgi:hypothetical protein
MVIGAAAIPQTRPHVMLVEHDMDAVHRRPPDRMVNGCVIANGTPKEPPDEGKPSRLLGRRALSTQDQLKTSLISAQGLHTYYGGSQHIPRGVNFTLGHETIGLMGSTVRAKARCSKPRRVGAARHRHHHGSAMAGRPTYELPDWCGLCARGARDLATSA